MKKQRNSKSINPSCGEDSCLDILFCVLPFGPIREPAIGVSILKSATEAIGLDSRVRYFSLDFAALIGVDLYHQITHAFAARELLGDWIFAKALFGSKTPDEKSYLSYLFRYFSRWEDGVPYENDSGTHLGPKHFIERKLMPRILEARRATSDFVDKVVQEIIKSRPKIAAFTSSCHQACSCLAVAKRLKSISPFTTLIFGGPNCQGEMGRQWLRSFPWIDYVCTGEGEEVFPEFLHRLLCSSDPSPPSGILRQGDRVPDTIPDLVRNLDRSPEPDYSDYLIQLERSPIRLKIGTPRLPLEMSRGCWWGERNQCVFCGDHRSMIYYRSKSPQRVLDEIITQAGSGKFRMIVFTDDVLNGDHIDTVFSELREKAMPLPIFIQIRPTLKRHELCQLRQGGVRLVEAGIESLSDEVLRLMRKGCTSLQNIQFLRWCGELGIKVMWSFLYGIAREPIDEYKRISKIVPLLTHLDPPFGCTWIALKRFSPYWMSSHELGFTNVKPWPSYSLIYPMPKEEIQRFAYYFDYDYDDERDPFEYTQVLRKVVSAWRELWDMPSTNRPRLDAFPVGDVVAITDTRPCATQKAHRLTGTAAQVYKLCDTVRSFPALVKELGNQNSQPMIHRALSMLVRNRLVFENNGSYVSLAIMRRRPQGEEKKFTERSDCD